MNSILANRNRLALPLRWGATGALLALGAPVGLFLVRGIEAGALSLAEVRDDWLTYAYLAVSSVIAFAIFGWMLGVQIARFRLLSNTDALTGLPNRQQLSLLLVDVDNLKQINDRRGHADGDRALRWVADAIRRVLRESDFASRRSGDEFVIVAPATDQPAAAVLGNRIREKVGNNPDLTGHISVSVGVAGWPDGNPAPLAERGLLAAADAALYAAKHAGRNAVRRHDESHLPESRHA